MDVEFVDLAVDVARTRPMLWTLQLTSSLDHGTWDAGINLLAQGCLLPRLAGRAR